MQSRKFNIDTKNGAVEKVTQIPKSGDFGYSSEKSGVQLPIYWVAPPPSNSGK